MQNCTTQLSKFIFSLLLKSRLKDMTVAVHRGQPAKPGKWPEYKFCLCLCSTRAKSNQQHLLRISLAVKACFRFLITFFIRKIFHTADTQCILWSQTVLKGYQIKTEFIQFAEL